MNKKLVLLGLLLAMVLSACGASAPEWTTFTSNAGGFSVSAPGTFKESSQTSSTAAGNVELHQFALDRGNVGYMVMYTDFPADLVKMANANDLLDGGVNGAIQSLGATLTDKKYITLNGAPGVEFSGALADSKNFPGGGVLRARAFMVQARLYVVFAAASKSSEAAAELTKYLDSFKLLNPPKSENPASSAVASAGGSKSSAASVMGAASQSAPASSASASSAASKPAGKYDTTFPLPAVVENFTGTDASGINFQTNLSLSDVMKFYREALGKQGLTEWGEATRQTDGTFNLVFRGAPNGKSVVVQGVALGSKSNVNIRFEVL